MMLSGNRRAPTSKFQGLEPFYYSCQNRSPSSVRSTTCLAT